MPIAYEHRNRPIDAFDVIRRPDQAVPMVFDVDRRGVPDLGLPPRSESCHHRDTAVTARAGWGAAAVVESGDILSDQALPLR
jgi:hypothetical protein